MRNRLLCLVFFSAFGSSCCEAQTDKAILPGQGFDSSHYEVLWTKSPFAVASAEPAAVSTHYSLVGVAEINGVTYASLVDKQSDEHFLLSSSKPDRGLTLLSVTQGRDASSTQAVIQAGGQSISLKLDQSFQNTSVQPVNTAMPSDGQVSSDPEGTSNMSPSQMPPPVRIRPRLIRIPPNPSQSSDPTMSQP